MVETENRLSTGGVVLLGVVLAACSSILWKAGTLMLNVGVAWGTWEYGQRMVLLFWLTASAFAVYLGVRGCFLAWKRGVLLDKSLVGFLGISLLVFGHVGSSLHLAVFPFYWTYLYVGFDPVELSLNLVPIPLVLWYSKEAIGSFAFWRLLRSGVTRPDDEVHDTDTT